MNDGVYASITAIQNMEAACARFARVLVERLPDVERELRQVTDALEERRANLHREIASLQDEISSANEDDDLSWERRRLEEAEDELASTQKRIRRLSEASANHAAQARRVEHLATDHAVRTREFLNGAADDLKAYLAKTNDGVSGGAVTVGPDSPGKGLDELTSAEKQPLHNDTGFKLDETAALHVSQARDLFDKIDTFPGSYSYWKTIGDVKELPALGGDQREGNPLFREALYHLVLAQKRGTSNSEIVNQLYEHSQLPKPIIEIRKERVIGNFKEMRLLGLDTTENIKLLKEGKAPLITKGNPKYLGERAEVDHMVSVLQALQFKNEVANYQLLPQSINRTKRGSSCEGHQAKLESAYKAAYQAELKSANEPANHLQQ